MQAYLYRRGPDALEAAGIAVAHNLNDLYDVLTQMGDPYTFIFCSAKSGDAMETFAKYDPSHDYEELSHILPTHGGKTSISESASEMKRRWKKFIEGDRPQGVRMARLV